MIKKGKVTHNECVFTDCHDGHLEIRFERAINMNAINQTVLLTLTDIAKELTDAEDIQTVTITGRKDIFSAGIDLKDSAKWEEGSLSLLARREIAKRGARMCQLWENLPQITVAAIEGAAIGGGAGLALACDWRVASSASSIFLPEVKMAMNMGWGAIPRLIGLVGIARAKQILILCESITATQAHDWGLVDWLADVGDSVKVANEVCARVRESNPAVVRMTKEAANACGHALDKVSIYMDADQGLVCRDSNEAQLLREEFKRGNYRG